MKILVFSILVRLTFHSILILRLAGVFTGTDAPRPVLPNHGWLPGTIPCRPWVTGMTTGVYDLDWMSIAAPFYYQHL